MPPADTSFLPSRNGLPFPNNWPAEPAVTLRWLPGAPGIGNAARGLCGGMVFTALDYWLAGLRPPAGQPVPGDPLYVFIVARLVRSWQFGAGVLRYYRWMTRPEDAAMRTLARHWPRIRARLDAGSPVPLGLVTVASANPLLLGHNHQVLAYGYQSGPAGTVRLKVYDPNSGPCDDAGIEFQPARPGAGFAHNLRIGRPVFGFFVTRYAPVLPPLPWPAPA